MLMQVFSLDMLLADEPWAKQARPNAVESARWRLAPVAEALGDKQWLTGRFTVADIMMVTVLRCLRHTDIVGDYPKLADQAADLGEPVKLDDLASV